MERRNPAEWYVFKGGQQSGPYTMEEIESFVASGKLQPTHQITAHRIGGRWISVDQFKKKYADFITKTHLPPRPAEDVTGFVRRTAATPVPAPDATQNLFDALQLAKEKKGPQPLDPSAWGAPTHKPKRIPRQASLVITLTLVCGSLLWGLSRLTAKTAGTPSSAVTNTIETSDRPPSKLFQPAALSPTGFSSHVARRPSPRNRAPARITTPTAPPPPPQVQEAEPIESHDDPNAPQTEIRPVPIERSAHHEELGNSEQQSDRNPAGSGGPGTMPLDPNAAPIEGPNRDLQPGSSPDALPALGAPIDQ